MEDELKKIYETELRHLKSHADEISRDQRFVKLSEKIGLGPDARLHDPFVEWLLEGYAFLASRVQLKLDGEFPRFTQNLLSVVQPHLMAPTPSMVVAEFEVSDAKNVLSGPTIERGRRLFLPAKVPGRMGGRKRDIVYTTGRDLRLVPLHVVDVEYLPTRAAVASRGASAKAPAGVLVEFAVQGDELLSALKMDEIDLFMTNSDRDGSRLFEALALSGASAEVVAPPSMRSTQVDNRRVLRVSPLGFERKVEGEGGEISEDFLLPYDERVFDGYRLLHEFFALPARFHFLRLAGLQKALQGMSGSSFKLLFLFDRPFEKLENRLRKEDVRLNCVPAINLFSHSADEMRISPKRVENHILPDRGEPTRYEVHSVTSATGRLSTGEEQTFKPFFSVEGLGAEPNARYFALNRTARADLKSRPDRSADRDKATDMYRGSEVFISLVDEAAKPISDELRSLELDLLCTNRHLPLYARNAMETRVELRSETEGDWASIKIAAGPSEPRPGIPEGRKLWDAIGHMSLNYLSLFDAPEGQSIAALRQLMQIYAPRRNPAATKTIEALLDVSVSQAVARSNLNSSSGPVPPVSFLRGQQISLTVDPDHDTVATLAAVLEKFFSGYAVANSFIQLSVDDANGVERQKWPPRAGSKSLL